jgi:DNA-binding transcriptional regulator PaaX
MHGVGILHPIAQFTNGMFEANAGSLFPALHRMEEAGWLIFSWAESDTNRRAKFYRLTMAGSKLPYSESDRRARTSVAMARALGATQEAGCDSSIARSLAELF